MAARHDAEREHWVDGALDELLDGDADALRALLPPRVDSGPDRLEKGLAQLVLTIVDLLRQVMERQAIRRMEHGTLDAEEIERLGRAFMALAARMDELREVFGLEDDDLGLDLGPLGRLT